MVKRNTFVLLKFKARVLRFKDIYFKETDNKHNNYKVTIRQRETKMAA